MAGLIKKSLDSPEETRPFEEGKGKLELINVASGPVGRATFEPGWQWSKHLQPVVGGDSCQKHHLLYILSGEMFAKMPDGEEVKFVPGDVAVIPPGHDGWNAGDKPVVWLEIPH